MAELTTQSRILNATVLTDLMEEHSGFNTTDVHVHKDKDNDPQAIYCIVTFIGAGIAICAILLTLFSYVGYRKFNVKRTHIIMMNLCVNLLIYFIAYALSNPHRQYYHSFYEGHGLCIAGAFLCHFAVLSSWFWIATYWILLFVMFKRPLGGHINHFFLKSALPAYGVPSLASLIAIIVAKANGDIYSEAHFYFSERCFVANNYLFVSLIAPFTIAAFPVLAVFFYVLCGIMRTNLSEREQRNIPKIRSHLIKLSVITVFIALVVLSTVILPAAKHRAVYSNSSAWAAVICFTVGSIALGVLLMFFFCIHQKEIRRHWVGIVRGEKLDYSQRNIGRIRRGTSDVTVSYGSRKSSTTNGRQPMFYVEEPEDSFKKLSTIRIVPKDDADMSTLSLIKIPGSPSVERHETANKDDAASKEEQNNRKVSIASNNNEAKRSSKNFVKRDSFRLKNTSSASSAHHYGKMKVHKKMKSVDKLLAKTNRKDCKRRSFSTSNIRKPSENETKSISKRESSLSNDSTQTTNFD